MREPKAPRITVQELTVVKNALEHPPPKADVFATIASTLSALLTAGKIVADVLHRNPAKPTIIEAVVFVVAIGVAGILLYRFFEARSKKHPFHDQAFKYIKSLVGEE